MTRALRVENLLIPSPEVATISIILDMAILFSLGEAHMTPFFHGHARLENFKNRSLSVPWELLRLPFEL